MKTIIKNAFKVRRKLIRDGRSRLDPIWAEQQMKNIEYWLATAPVNRVCKNHTDLIIILLPNNFIANFKAKFHEHNY